MGSTNPGTFGWIPQKVVGRFIAVRTVVGGHILEVFLAVRTVVRPNITEVILAVRMVVGANMFEVTFSCLHGGRDEYF